MMEKYLLQGHAAFWLGCLWIKSSNEEETREENSLANKNIIRQSFGKKRNKCALKELGTSITVDKVSAERKREEKWLGQSPSGI